MSACRSRNRGGRAIAMIVAIGSALSCAVGGGEGQIVGTLQVPNCWSGKIDLAPDFFGAIPYRDTLMIRVQRGTNLPTYSDQVSILVASIKNARSRLGESLLVDLPPEVTPPGIPVERRTPPLVSLSLSLQASCKAETTALYASVAALDANGRCGEGDDPCGPPVTRLSSDGKLLGESKITFRSVFSGTPDEPSAEERLTDAEFDVYLVDPRDRAAGQEPPSCRGHLCGKFRFHFERGRPAQPFQ